MALAKDSEAYLLLRDIVGQENITTDPVMMDSYLWQWLGDSVDKKGNCFMPIRPEAVVMPGSTEEVQDVVRACNRHGLKQKAHSTGWISAAAPLTEGVVLIDLRRMNRIVEINTKDMYAVVEPYVSFAQLQAEIMRKGFSCEVNAAGSNCSVLAQATAGFGAGYGNYHMGYGSGTLNGVEWVLPDGEILRMGSLGSGCGWISPDGPGPGLKGIMRGHTGNLGGCGVFTKCAIRIYHWAGPPELEIENITPVQTRLLEYPENLALYYFYFDDYESRAEAICAMGEEDIGYVMGFMSRGLLTLAAGDSNAEFVDLRENLFDALPEICFCALLAADSVEELEHQKKVVDRILEETNGGSADIMQNQPLKDIFTLHLLKVGSLSAHSTAGRTAGFLCTPASTALTRRLLGKFESLGIELKKKYIEAGHLLDDGGEGGWGTIWDHGHAMYFENMAFWDSPDPESAQAHLDLQAEINTETVEKLKYLSFLGTLVEGLGNMTTEDLVSLRSLTASDLIERGPELAKMHSPYDERLGPLLSNCHVWLRRIRGELDPNNSSDPTPA